MQPFVIPALLLLALNLYSSDTTSTRLVSSSKLASLWSVLKQAPGWWEWLLRTSSPVFTILEGISTLLCIQALSRFSIRRIEKSRAPDSLQLLVLVLAAGVYVVSAYFLWEVSWISCRVYGRAGADLSAIQSYDSVPDRISATLIGVAITSVIFLSGISFAVQKGNVVETSLMLA